jgi:hypothetical protein
MNERRARIYYGGLSVEVQGEIREIEYETDAGQVRWWFRVPEFNTSLHLTLLEEDRITSLCYEDANL